MRTLTLTFDHFHFTADLKADKGLLKHVHFDVLKPDETIVVQVHAPVINDLRLELDLVRFEDGVLTLHSLSNRRIVDMLINFFERYVRSVPFLRVEHPHIMVNTDVLGRMYFPDLRIRHIRVEDKHYIIETEII